MIYSDLTLKELSGKITDIPGLMRDINTKRVDITAEDIDKAEAIIRTGLLHRTDAVHVSVAKRNNAVFVTRDKEILTCGLIKAYVPENVPS